MLYFQLLYQIYFVFENSNKFHKTLVKEGESIGANATIVCGNIIGKHSFIGAGSVITREVPDYAIMVGNPAKQIGWMCECGKKLDKILKCSNCTRIYIKKDEILTEKI